MLPIDYIYSTCTYLYFGVCQLYGEWIYPLLARSSLDAALYDFNNMYPVSYGTESLNLYTKNHTINYGPDSLTINGSSILLKPNDTFQTDPKHITLRDGFVVEFDLFISREKDEEVDDEATSDLIKITNDVQLSIKSHENSLYNQLQLTANNRIEVCNLMLLTNSWNRIKLQNTNKHLQLFINEQSCLIRIPFNQSEGPITLSGLSKVVIVLIDNLRVSNYVHNVASLPSNRFDGLMFAGDELAQKDVFNLCTAPYTFCLNDDFYQDFKWAFGLKSNALWTKENVSSNNFETAALICCLQ